MRFPDPKVGDKVALPFSRFGTRISSYEFDAIARVTPAQVILAGRPEVRWRRDNGRRIGTEHGYILPWEPAHDDFMAAVKAADRLYAVAEKLVAELCKSSLVADPAAVARAQGLADTIESYLAPKEPTP